MTTEIFTLLMYVVKHDTESVLSVSELMQTSPFLFAYQFGNISQFEGFCAVLACISFYFIICLVVASIATGSTDPLILLEAFPSLAVPVLFAASLMLLIVIITVMCLVTAYRKDEELCSAEEIEPLNMDSSHNLGSLLPTTQPSYSPLEMDTSKQK